MIRMTRVRRGLMTDVRGAFHLARQMCGGLYPSDLDVEADLEMSASEAEIETIEAVQKRLRKVEREVLDALRELAGQPQRSRGRR